MIKGDIEDLKKHYGEATQREQCIVLISEISAELKNLELMEAAKDGKIGGGV